MALGLDAAHGHPVALGHVGQDPLLVLEVALGIVGALDVGPQEARVVDGLAGGRELGVTAVARRGPEPHLHALAPGVGHLGGDGALPDQLVETELVALQLALDLLGEAEAVARGADRLVGLLGVLDLVGVLPRGVGQVVLAVLLQDLGPGGGHGGVRQRRAVGPHVGDVAVLVEALGHAHGPGGREAQLAPRLLLEGRGHERRVGLAGVGLGLHRPDGDVGAVEGRRPGPGPRPRPAGSRRPGAGRPRRSPCPWPGGPRRRRPGWHRSRPAARRRRTGRRGPSRRRP